MNVNKANQLTSLNTQLPTGFIRFNSQANNKVRFLILPDWQGANTWYMQRMASLFGEVLNAETIILHPYDVETHPTHYSEHGRFAVHEVLIDRIRSRMMMKQVLNELDLHWENRELPLVMVGFCLGGTLSFEAARVCNQAQLAVSLHGNPSTDLLIAPQSSDTPMVFIDGGSDPLIPRADVSLFLREMHPNQRPWFYHMLGRSRHSFTKEEVGTIGPGSVFDADALKLSVDLVASHVKQITQA
jgi:dienelactone hydrolase